MAVPTSLLPSSLLLLLLSSYLVRPLSPDEPATDSRKSPPQSGGPPGPPANPSPSPELHPALRRRLSPFHPSMMVIVGLLTTMFSATFLLLLYAKHCKRGSGYSYSGNLYPTHYPVGTSTAGRKNSGIDRAVIESLPVFRFQSLSGHKDGLECTVCLARFEPLEVLRLLPKCKHAFHVECVDTWLDAHSTCPLCRYRVDPEDVLLVDRQVISSPPQNHVLEIGEGTSQPEVRRISGRHSSAGERGRFLQFLQHKRWSLDLKSKKSDSSINLRCVDRNLRKDGLLLTNDCNRDQPPVENDRKRTSAEERRRRRLDHRIIISAGDRQRWSNVEPSDLLYLQSEMIMCNVSRRIGRGGGGVSTINGRSMSEITGLSRFQSIGGADKDRKSRNSTSHSNGIINSCNGQERERQWQWPERPQEGR
ncbi:hypothetical protein CDL15_Pgr015977 [Punica granatum]|uniref:RING-type E3 ubiquitin transferase n=1 Tax=Punica granatum TaxID=22663 RepID=A0A218XR00_PUNGR|nr:hypothetical protein CDL15_Pgr015977 [Punica granatum]